MRKENHSAPEWQKEGHGPKERCIFREEADYPRRLRQIRSAPRRIFVGGRLPDAQTASGAVIGARKCSSYGREMARLYASALAAAGVQIVSGMAAGIDGIAQRAALSVGGSSVAVLGCGTDVCYPAENRDLYEQLLQKGTILSEYSPGTPPAACYFPARNRIISALADLILVIEARERSGTLITVDFALDQGKDVYALPGRITDGQSMGCNRLIRQGAGIALTPEDILEALDISCQEMAPAASNGSRGMADGKKERAGEAALPSGMGPRERLVWQQVGDRPITLQELYEKVRETEEGKEFGLPEVTDILMDLVLRELISREYGNKYERKAE